MAGANETWLETGVGRPPEELWSFSTESRLSHLALAWESDEVLAADDAGGLYLFDPAGRLRQLSRGLAKIGAISIADAGICSAVAFDERKVALLDGSLSVAWSLNLYDRVVAVALDPFGRHLAIALANRDVRVYTTTRRRVAEFESVRPLKFLRFAANEAVLIGAAEDGLLAAHDALGRQRWDVRLFASCGDMAVSGDARTILLAGFAHGIQRFDGSGTNRGAFVVEGTPARISTSYDGSHIVAATIERQIYLLERTGELRWAAEAPDDVAAVRLDGPGRSIAVGFASGRVARLGW